MFEIKYTHIFCVLYVHGWNMRRLRIYMWAHSNPNHSLPLPFLLSTKLCMHSSPSAKTNPIPTFKCICACPRKENSSTHNHMHTGRETKTRMYAHTNNKPRLTDVTERNGVFSLWCMYNAPIFQDKKKKKLKQHALPSIQQIHTPEYTEHYNISPCIVLQCT